MKKWKNFKGWQKGAIVFGVIHILLYLLLFIPYEKFSGEGTILLILLESPIIILSAVINYFLIEILKLDINYFRLFDSKLGYYSVFLWGTLAYAAIGGILGLLLSLIKSSINPNREMQK